MATGVNILKQATNLFRNRLATFQEITEIYAPNIIRRKNKLMQLLKEKAEQASQSKVAKQLRVAKEYYTLEMSPPNVNEMQKLQADIALIKEFIQSGCYKFLTVKQAWLLFLVGVEISLWFFLGETIGKMHIVGYKV